MSGIDFTSVEVTISDKALMQTIDNEAVILHLENEHYYGLNESSLHIWILLEKYRKPELVMAHMLNDYNVEASRLEKDLLLLLNDLLKNQLIHIKTL